LIALLKPSSGIPLAVSHHLGVVAAERRDTGGIARVKTKWVVSPCWRHTLLPMTWEPVRVVHAGLADPIVSDTSTKVVTALIG
jgi:hypothetical protein